jgi:hypothetical protein
MGIYIFFIGIKPNACAVITSLFKIGAGIVDEAYTGEILIKIIKV